ncbi:MAG: hypothetical protein CLLPBCKN_006852 [Chroococcidiopsis cubana SAG 39.79]|uniref:Pvc16 N-terminal domain-containing protein n=1 Tax=Chroococcidiopsis cubana SAG 39.79 TaxID=388085 RepID=A0AB37UIN6_9CYAN|nr:DUF4255 domain-containing protein [Chroococcidiopsis cubana]MDZ4877417.1 hypothetical protein [Chroococcidiopsis cubana SAG 39.79]PSB59542.1 DUF4255 domain-containing protein [Chroococcidiopsis cubana CCALA 043]RUT11243.1 hypothetical protein DSM107010_35120 [Chroococcidiopsis cubana SAG 39.79]
MSSQLILIAVTAVLKDLLENGLVESAAIMSSLGDLKVTTQPPDRISVGTDDQTQLNLFLYQMTQNRNADWIAQKRRNRNQSVENPGSEKPPLGLNLHYLLTAYGSKDFQTEWILGHAMQVLRDMQITRDTIDRSLKHIADNTDGFLAQALAKTSITDLCEQIGEIKIYPKFFNTEEMSKLWSFLHASYRPSIAYEVSTVLID